MTTVTEQSEIAMKLWATSRRNNLSASTLRSYRSYLDCWIVPKLGTFDIGTVKNGEMKMLVDALVEENRSAATISGVTTCLKKLVGSVIDSNGNRLYPVDWNAAFIDAPAVDPSKQYAPTIGPTELSAALRAADGYWRTLFALQAGTGLRISEVRALRKGPDTGSGSCWDPETALIHVRDQISAEQTVITPKTTASTRVVNVYPKLNAWVAARLADKKPGEFLFLTRNGGFLQPKTINTKVHACGIPGTHSLRRFRVTHLDQVGVQRRVVDYWTGHTGENITDRYSHPEKVAEWLVKTCERAGLGFEIPKEATNENTKVPNKRNGMGRKSRLESPQLERGEDLREVRSDPEFGVERQDVPCDVPAAAGI